MINTWGMCEFEGIVTTQMMRCDACCASFIPKDRKYVKEAAKACIHCVYWIGFDELPRGTEND
jgi:hypothetical protein